MTLDRVHDQIMEWLEAFRFGPSPDKIVHVDRDAGKVVIYLYTYINEYSIVAVPSNKYESGYYLGCVSSSRKPRPGEWWHRGRDLPDGEFSEETWHKILAAIVSYEAVDPARPASEKYQWRKSKWSEDRRDE